MLKDIEISQNAHMLPIEEIAKKVGIGKENLELYGKYKAKIDYSNIYSKTKSKKKGKLILVTAVSPTPAGEGKTTVSVGLSQAFWKIGKKSVVALREPSLGPVFGIKGGATGGGFSQVVPMEDINLHFTGDMHAITAANNLLCALIDNHIHSGNELNINPKTIFVNRCLDINDRVLRNVVVGLGGPFDGVTRPDGFIISVATEIMAILCLASSLDDLKKRLGSIFIGFSFSKNPVFAKDIKADGAMTALLKDALKPNLVQTLENTPALIHGGPFANIAHGCNSIMATRLAVELSDYAVTEAGFGSELGAEKFFNIKCRAGGFGPDCVVLVATVRALKYNGGVLKEDLQKKDKEALLKGICNLEKHIENIRLQCKNIVVALNLFETDTEEEIEIVENFCENLGVFVERVDVYRKGGEGALELAKKVSIICEKPSEFKFLYEDKISLEEKVKKIAVNFYGASEIKYETKAKKKLIEFSNMGFSDFPVCVAKTQYSLSTDPKKLGRPRNFEVIVKDIRLCSGAGFVVFLTDNVMTMPGLSKTPAANFVDVVNGKIKGLF